MDSIPNSMNAIHPYNTELNAVKLPEYGRNVQKLVEYCMTIPDREKRTHYATSIISIMADLYPEVAQSPEGLHILWDHLYLLSGFKLDVEYPFPVMKPEAFEQRPEKIPYQDNKMRFRMYGKALEDMVKKAMEVEDEEQRIRLFELCANHMKRHYHLANKEADEDNDKIIQDLLYYTQGQFKEDIYKVFLYSVKDLLENTQYDAANLEVIPKKKKKKKKK